MYMKGCNWDVQNATAELCGTFEIVFFYLNTVACVPSDRRVMRWEGRLERTLKGTMVFHSAVYLKACHSRVLFTLVLLRWHVLPSSLWGRDPAHTVIIYLWVIPMAISIKLSRRKRGAELSKHTLGLFFQSANSGPQVKRLWCSLTVFTSQLMSNEEQTEQPQSFWYTVIVTPESPHTMKSWTLSACTFVMLWG